MEPKSKKLEFKVGIFITVGLLAVLISILLLGGDKAFFTKYVRLNARFTEVQGLFPGSVVSLAGVPVGNVEAIGFVDAENRLNLTMKINDKFKNRLVEGTVAEIRTQGALGDKFIYLIPGPPDGKILADGSVVESLETDIMKMLTSREDGMARVIDLIKELHLMIASINQNGGLATTMKNMSEVSLKLKSTLTQLDGALADVRGDANDPKLKKSLASLTSILQKVDSGKGTLGQLINDPSIAQSLKSFLGGSERNRYMKDMIRETLQKSETGK
ncbi:MAG TPA: MlaD family protein [Bdellovibrionales bacterium]|nr:MlaD family protein [Bdellovibrionales bacterium]